MLASSRSSASCARAARSSDTACAAACCADGNLGVQPDELGPRHGDLGLQCHGFGALQMRDPPGEARQSASSSSTFLPLPNAMGVPTVGGTAGTPDAHLPDCR